MKPDVDNGFKLGTMLVCRNIKIGEENMYKSKYDGKSLYDCKSRLSNFDTNPKMSCNYEETVLIEGYEDIAKTLKAEVQNELKLKDRVTLVIDCYHGVDMKGVRSELLAKMDAVVIIDAADCLLAPEVLDQKFEKFINPSDRTYGVYAVADVEDYYDASKVDAARKELQSAKGLVVVFGIAASYIAEGDILVYGNITRSGISARWSDGLSNWGANNADLEKIQKEKRGTFLDWQVLDRYKRKLLNRMAYMVSFENKGAPVMVNGEAFRKEITYMSKRPFKCVPMFLPAVWGGDWIQTVIGAGKDQPNMGWGITGMIDIQSINLENHGQTITFPAQDMVAMKPTEFLGNKIFYFWGYKCPLHVNFLDTWNGGNLSLQVHPTTDYAYEVFNSSYGHHESYYILDAKPEASVYLGMKEGTKVDEFVEALEQAQETGEMDDGKYVNQIPVKKHDHVFIPGGTVHSSGQGSLVLEIDAFTFATFKLWDWGRVDLDGKPRPINIDHGKHCIQEKFQGDFVYDRLISKQFEVDRGYGWRKEDTSTIDYEPMTVNRYWFTERINFETNDNIIILVLAEGEEAIVESTDGSFEPLVIHYAEAMFVPADAHKYTVRPYGRSEGKELGLLEIYYPM